VRRGERVAYVVLRPGFGAAMDGPPGGAPPEVEIGVDPSHGAETGMLRGMLARHAAERFRKLAAAFGGDADAASLEPVRVEVRPVVAGDDEEAEINPWGISFPQGIAWGLMGAAIGFALSLVVERRQGTLARLRASPIGSARILAGKAIACFVTEVGVAVVLLALGVLAFGIRPASPVLLVPAILCAAACFVGLMMLFSVLGRTESSAAGIGWASVCGMAMLGGGMVPLLFLQKVPFLSVLSHLSPVKWAILALEGALWRGFTPGEMALPCAMLLLFGAAAFAGGVVIFRRVEAV
jgi:ABC-2 type transport system permease protein